MKLDRIKEQLNLAIEKENVEEADKLTEELLSAQGLGPVAAVPEGFAAQIQKNGVSRKRVSRKKLFVVCVAVLVVVLSIGTVAYGAGILFPERANKDGSATPVNGAVASDEYKAVQEYLSCLDNMDEEEREKARNRSRDAVYDAPDKVKALSSLYGLRYATKSTELTSYKDVEQALSSKGLLEKWDVNFMKDVQLSIKETFRGFHFDDGNLSIDTVVRDRVNRGDKLGVSICLTPEGSFPWVGFSANQGPEKSRKESYLVNAGNNSFTCTESSSGGLLAFGKIGNEYVTIELTRIDTKGQDRYYKSLESLRKSAEAQLRDRTKLESLNELGEKISTGMGAALDKGEKISGGNPNEYENMLKQYANLTDEEWAIWDNYRDSEEKLNLSQPESISKTQAAQYLSYILKE